MRFWILVGVFASGLASANECSDRVGGLHRRAFLQWLGMGTVAAALTPIGPTSAPEPPPRVPWAIKWTGREIPSLEQIGMPSEFFHKGLFKEGTHIFLPVEATPHLERLEGIQATSKNVWIGTERLAANIQPHLNIYLHPKSETEARVLAGHEIRKHIALANDLPLSQAVAHPDWNLVEFARLKGKALYALGRTIQEPQAGTLPAEGVGIIFIENVVEDPGNNPSRFYIGPPPASSVRFVDDFESD